MKADVDLPRALLKLPVEGDLTQEVKDALEKFVCLKYYPKGVRITSIPYFLDYSAPLFSSRPRIDRALCPVLRVILRALE